MDNLIVELLNRTDRGSRLAEASAKLRELVKAVEDTGKPGKVTLEFAVKPVELGQMNVAITAKATIPARPPKLNLWFVVDGDGLSRRDPNQREFEMGVITGDAGEETTVEERKQSDGH